MCLVPIDDDERLVLEAVTGIRLVRSPGSPARGRRDDLSGGHIAMRTTHLVVAHAGECAREGHPFSLLTCARALGLSPKTIYRHRRVARALGIWPPGVPQARPGRPPAATRVGPRRRAAATSPPPLWAVRRVASEGEGAGEEEEHMSGTIICPTGKLGHATYAAALKAITRAGSRSLGVGKYGPGQLRPYRCQICKHYHLGHVPIRPLNKRAAGLPTAARRSS